MAFALVNMLHSDSHWSFPSSNSPLVQGFISISDMFRAQKWSLTPEWEVLLWTSETHYNMLLSASKLLIFNSGKVLKQASSVQDLASDLDLQGQKITAGVSKPSTLLLLQAQKIK